MGYEAGIFSEGSFFLGFKTKTRLQGIQEGGRE